MPSQRTVAIALTSLGPAQARDALAPNLAWAFGRRGWRVLLLDARAARWSEADEVVAAGAWTGEGEPVEAWPGVVVGSGRPGEATAAGCDLVLIDAEALTADGVVDLVDRADLALLAVPDDVVALEVVNDAASALAGDGGTNTRLLLLGDDAEATRAGEFLTGPALDMLLRPSVLPEVARTILGDYDSRATNTLLEFVGNLSRAVRARALGDDGDAVAEPPGEPGAQNPSPRPTADEAPASARSAAPGEEAPRQEAAGEQEPSGTPQMPRAPFAVDDDIDFVVPVPVPPSGQQASRDAAAPPAARKAHTIAFASHKGGTGRTTAMIGLAETLGRRGKRVLLIDASPVPILDLLGAPGAEVFPNVFVGEGRPGEAAERGADLVLIDAPAIFDEGARDLMRRTDGVILTTLCEPLSLRTAGSAIAALGGGDDTDEGDDAPAPVELLGVVANIYDDGDATQRAMLDELRTELGDALLGRPIPVDAELADWAGGLGLDDEGPAGLACSDETRAALEALATHVERVVDRADPETAPVHAPVLVFECGPGAQRAAAAAFVALSRAFADRDLHLAWIDARSEPTLHDALAPGSRDLVRLLGRDDRIGVRDDLVLVLSDPLDEAGADGVGAQVRRAILPHCSMLVSLGARAGDALPAELPDAAGHLVWPFAEGGDEGQPLAPSFVAWAVCGRLAEPVPPGADRTALEALADRLLEKLAAERPALAEARGRIGLDATLVEAPLRIAVVEVGEGGGESLSRRIVEGLRARAAALGFDVDGQPGMAGGGRVSIEALGSLDADEAERSHSADRVVAVCSAADPLAFREAHGAAAACGVDPAVWIVDAEVSFEDHLQMLLGGDAVCIWPGSGSSSEDAEVALLGALSGLCERRSGGTDVGLVAAGSDGRVGATLQMVPLDHALVPAGMHGAAVRPEGGALATTLRVHAGSVSVESRARGDALAVRCPLALEPERPRFSPQQRLALNLLRSGAAAAPSGGGAEAERLLEVLVGATDTAAVRALVQAVSACAGSVDACGAAARAAAAALDDASDARVGAGFRRLGLAPVVTLARLGDGCQQVFGGFTPAATQALRAVLCTRAGRKDEAVAAGRRLAGLDPGDFLRRSWFDGVVGGDGAAAGDEATDAVAAGNVVGASTADREEGRSDAG